VGTDPEALTPFGTPPLLPLARVGMIAGVKRQAKAPHGVSPHRAPIARHRTAIGRPELSRPLRLALQDGLLTAETSVFDYGCGRGDDLQRLRSRRSPATAGTRYIGQGGPGAKPIL
jgi:hypothetical protein